LVTDRPSKNEHPLPKQVEFLSANCVKTALQCGADINGKSKRGHTPLAFAKSLGWKKVAMLLHKKGGE